MSYSAATGLISVAFSTPVEFLIMRLALPLILLILVGCGPAPRTDLDGAGQPIPKPLETDSWKTVPSKDFESWKPYPVRTRVVRTNVTTTSAGSNKIVETWTLQNSSASNVEVENQITSTRGDGTYHRVNEPRVFKYPATLKMHPDLKIEQFTKPDPKAKESGKEKLTILGKEYDCDIYEWAASTEAGMMNIRAWVSPTMPGQYAKQVMTVKDHSETVQQITELVVPKEK